MRDANLSAMRPVVEKELLHHEIFQALDAAGLLKHLVFQGGTSLRLCRGSDRFSEDLDFAGGRDFTADKMQSIKECVEKHIGARFGLKVTVKEPKPLEATRSRVSVDKWWISIETAPGNAAMPRQKIKLEVANIQAYQFELVPLRHNYEFLGGMKEVLVNAESVSEILADKIVAFPTSLVNNNGDPLPPTAAKIRYRDIWDIAWLLKKRAELDPHMVACKIQDYGIPNFPELLERAIEMIPAVVKSAEFKDQMRRFIDTGTVKKTLDDERYLDYLASTVGGQFQEAKEKLAWQAAERTARRQQIEQALQRPQESTESADKAKSMQPESGPGQDGAAAPEKQTTADASGGREKQAMEQAMERWLDGDRSSGPVKAFIAAHDRATRQGTNGRTLIAEVVDRVVTRRGDGVAADLGGFMASIERQRKREQGMGR